MSEVLAGISTLTGADPRLRPIELAMDDRRSDEPTERTQHVEAALPCDRHAAYATNHWQDVAELRRVLPDTRVLEESRWVDEGTVVTSAGISAGLDMSLHIVARLAGKELAARTARQMEYEWP